MRTILFLKAVDANDPGPVYAKRAKFSLRSRVKSFAFAGSGIIRFFKTEPNAKLHLAAACGVTALSFYFHISKGEAIAIVFSIAIVWVAEMFNTAIEKTMDFISKERHPQIKAVKDIAAGAVLVASLAALITGGIIFIPKIF